MLHWLTAIAIAAPRRVLAAAAVLMAAAAVFGLPVAKSLSAGGFQDPGSESSRAAAVLTSTLNQPAGQVMFLVTAPEDILGPTARAAGLDIVSHVDGAPAVVNVVSPWTAPPPLAGQLISSDGRAGLVIAAMAGGEDEAAAQAQALTDSVSETVLSRHRDVTVLAGGTGTVFAQINAQTERDMMIMESIALPISFALMVWVFGGLLTAALPVLVGGIAILGSMSALRLIALTTPVSIFALNLAVALGLALAIDYTLLLVSRYRDEIAEGADPERALYHTMDSAGRTVVFSAITVALSMASMILFPMYFLKSFAYAGVATVVVCALAALVVTPAAIVVMGERLNSGGLGRTPTAKHRLRPSERPVRQRFWYRWARMVMRHAVPIGLAGAAVLIVLGLPFLGIRWGFPDDRVLPQSASAREVGDRVRADFTVNSAAAVTVVVPHADGLSPADLDRYAARLSRVSEVQQVSSPAGAFRDGVGDGPPVTPAGQRAGAAFLTIDSTAPLFSAASQGQLERLHEVETPGGRAVEFTGMAQINHDSVSAITARVPLVLTVIAIVTFVLLFVLTGSIVLPLKALVLNLLSLTAAFGALVWIFQDGHLGAFGTTPTGTLVANMPVLLFCIAFGLSMDYEVFLISRIREYWLASGRTPEDNDEAVALGLAHTGRVITAAALVMSVSFAAMIAAHVSFMRMFGVGLTLAVVADATLVRMVLVPAFMHMLGRWNWWSPAPLRRVFPVNGHGKEISS